MTEKQKKKSLKGCPYKFCDGCQYFEETDRCCFCHFGWDLLRSHLIKGGVPRFSTEAQGQSG